MMNVSIVSIAMGLAAAAGSATAQTRAPSAAQIEDAEQDRILQQAFSLVRDHKPEVALTEHIERVIAFYERRQLVGDQQVYCARNLGETIAVLAKHAAAKTGKPAIAVSPVSCDAYFLKGYALIELGRIPEAKAALQLAVARAPFRSHYLAELGVVYLKEKDWEKALETYRAAEKVSSSSGDEPSKKRDALRARRGMGYALIELNRLDEAEALYTACLEEDASDALSRSQLEYIRKLRASRAPS